ncbi:hypothetical protein [Saccharibacillus qingshengii]|uniref:hypothetical protein n=1 Tax=Saccharibacillus qingshengii TaxID=1763540 RepID=UPI001552C0DF|nr:hypothetical protein [Saccharibacillus qingshengii]
MKKTLIGCVLTLAGTWIVGCIFVAAALFVPNMSSWEGTRLWYAIFGGSPYEADLKQSMALGLPFAIGMLMFASGIVILAVEYFRPEARRDSAVAPVRFEAKAPASIPAPGPRPLVTAGDRPAGDNEEIPTMKEVRS